MLIIDSHLDLSYNALNWNRDITLPCAEIRASEDYLAADRGRATNTVSLPEMRRGEVVVCLATVLGRANPQGRTHLDYRTQEIACAMTQGQLAYYRLLERRNQLRMLLTGAAVREHVAQWKASAGEGTPLGYILSMEGADPILTPDHLGEWHADGLRVIGLSHYGPSAYAHGTACEGGLTPAGRMLLARMRDLGVILDATHLADQSFWEALEAYDGPVLASHNNCRALVPGDRQFSDEQIRALIARDAVIGAAFDVWMLLPNWEYGKTPREAVRLDHVADHIDHVCQLAGNTRHSAIGTDLDGGFGTEQSPCDLDTIADVQKVAGILASRGYPAADVEAIMYGNWLRFFEKNLV